MIILKKAYFCVLGKDIGSTARNSDKIRLYEI
jgi:hypothetical protein